MERSISPKERRELQKRHKRERDKRVCDRIKAVLAYDEGYSYEDVAQILLLDEGTIRRHIDSYFSKQKLKPDNGGGTSYLNQIETETLTSHLQEKTYLYVKDICAYVKKNFDKGYSISGMTKWLQANDFRYKKPHGVPAKADKDKQEAFKRFYASLKESLPADEKIYFADSSHPQHQTRLAYGWIARGSRKSEKLTSCQKRINIVSAINLANHHIEYRQVDWVNNESLKVFCEQLIRANEQASTIHLILDNAGYHKSKDFLSYIDSTKIKVHYLPAYSPNLNPIERLWKIMHEKVTYNRYYEKFADFTEGIMGFFENIQNHADIIRARINDNFQTLS